jgi:hypothetical protein
MCYCKAVVHALLSSPVFRLCQGARVCCHNNLKILELLLSIVDPVIYVNLLVDCWHSLVCEDCLSFFVIVDDFVQFHGDLLHGRSTTDDSSTIVESRTDCTEFKSKKYEHFLNFRHGILEIVGQSSYLSWSYSDPSPVVVFRY